MYNATEISEQIGMSKSKVLSLIKDGILVTSKEKEVYFRGQHTTVRYVSQDTIDEFVKSDIYNDYLAKKAKREENKKKRMEKFEREMEEAKLKRECEIKKYIENLGGITDTLLGLVVYSFSKRAKNSENIEDKSELYSKKDRILKRYAPIEIHLNRRNITYINYPDEYIYDCEKELYRVNKEVIDVLYYYIIGDFTFHTPINQIENLRELNLDTSLPIKEIELNSQLIDNSELLDLDICDYVLASI